MAVTENPATLAVFPVPTVTTAEDVACGIWHTIVVRTVLIASTHQTANRIIGVGCPAARDSVYHTLQTS